MQHTYRSPLNSYYSATSSTRTFLSFVLFNSVGTGVLWSGVEVCFPSEYHSAPPKFQIPNKPLLMPKKMLVSPLLMLEYNGIPYPARARPLSTQNISPKGTTNTKYWCPSRDHPMCPVHSVKYIWYVSFSVPER